jgi:hypothetical protein
MAVNPLNVEFDPAVPLLFAPAAPPAPPAPTVIAYVVPLTNVEDPVNNPPAPPPPEPLPPVPAAAPPPPPATIKYETTGGGGKVAFKALYVADMKPPR